MLKIGNTYTNGMVDVTLLRICPEHVVISTAVLRKKSFVRIEYFRRNYISSGIPIFSR